MKSYSIVVLVSAAVLFSCRLIPGSSHTSPRKIENFDHGWKFHLGDVADGQGVAVDDSQWRSLDLPHDWSIEGTFSPDHPATPGGGALPGGIGWYRKTFTLPAADKGRNFLIQFDGVYRNSEVWINGEFLGKRPYGYSSFQYELSPFLKYGVEKNVLAVRVDNSKQPNSRWYSGSGIYRHVRLVRTAPIHVDQWGTFITTPAVSEDSATVAMQIRVRNSGFVEKKITVRTVIAGAQGKKIAEVKSERVMSRFSAALLPQVKRISHPQRWAPDTPVCYQAVTTVSYDGSVQDEYTTTFGIRSFYFDREKGFFLNGQPLQIRGVCNHHDLGCLGTAVNRRAIERQLEIMKDMGVNAIRTSHNPPAPELLDLCDHMGFIVMDEAFDMWKRNKTDFDYALDWDAWHQRDLQDMVLRDRNHPSVFIWSIGNEVIEQYDPKDSSGAVIARELSRIVRSFDSTRPVTAACNHVAAENPLIKSTALDLVGFNYHHPLWHDFPSTFRGRTMIGSETVSALATRGHYDMPSDEIRRWPERWDKPFTAGNADNSCSSYDNCSAPWGSTHEESWKLIKKYGFLTGEFIWTGFDYLGEPTPYTWPSRSSYFGIVDLAGFPKDAYYLYQSEWTDKPVLHLFPHWNWQPGQAIDVWAYTNCEEVELFLNGQTQGMRKKEGDALHLEWHLTYAPGTLKAVGRRAGGEELTAEVRTAGAPARIRLQADRSRIAADGNDLSFVTVKIVDQEGTLAPLADNQVQFRISGPGRIAGVDNGLQTSHDSFQADYCKAWNGLCLAVVRSSGQAGQITLEASSDGLEGAAIEINAE